VVIHELKLDTSCAVIVTQVVWELCQ